MTWTLRSYSRSTKLLHWMLIKRVVLNLNDRLNPNPGPLAPKQSLKG